MCKLCHKLKTLLPGMLLLLSALLNAQEDRLDRARQLWRSDAEKAMLTIDSVIAHPQTRNDFVSWTVRAYIYFDIYRKNERMKLESPIRDTIVSSLIVSNSLKPDSDYATNNQKLLVNIAAGCFNLAKSLLVDSLSYHRSVIGYNKYKEIYGIANPQYDFAQKDIEYYLAVGSLYSDIFIRDNNKTDAGDIAKVALLKVFELQPDNPNANINMGLMYYNQSVNLSKSLDYGADFSQIDVVQENMVKLAKQAEQFIVKVYNGDNTNLKAVEALYYIYRMLNEIQKSDDFKKKGEALGIKFDPGGELKQEDKKEENKDQQNNDK